MIRKTSKGWIVVSHKGRNLGGPYKSLKAAKERLAIIEYFKKHRKKKK